MAAVFGFAAFSGEIGRKMFLTGLKILGAEINKCVEILFILMYLTDPKRHPTVGVVPVCLFQTTETRLKIKKYVLITMTFRTSEKLQPLIRTHKKHN